MNHIDQQDLKSSLKFEDLWFLFDLQIYNLKIFIVNHLIQPKIILFLQV